MIKRPILQFSPANKFANVQQGETTGDGIRGCRRLRFRQIREGLPHGGMGRTSVFFFGVKFGKSFVLSK